MISSGYFFYSLIYVCQLLVVFINFYFVEQKYNVLKKKIK